jgi:hypothetical protein
MDCAVGVAYLEEQIDAENQPHLRWTQWPAVRLMRTY